MTDQRTDTEREADEQAARARADIIAFLRSTTKTVTNREADGDTTTRVEHIARFAITPGTLIDIKGTRTSSFSPEWLEVTWSTGGKLVRVHLSGPQRLKAGGTSDKVTLRHDWGRWSNQGVDRDDLPEVIAFRIADYELAVAGQSHGSASIA